MSLVINSDYPIGIKTQVRQQLKTLILTGRFSRGEKLPSAGELAEMLSIHRNTVAQIYKELAQEGYVTITKGAGTFVVGQENPGQYDLLRQIFRQAYDMAVQSDFKPAMITDFFMSGLLESSRRKIPGGNIILIDCNYEILKGLDQQIKEQCSVNTHLMLIQDIEALPEKFIKRAREYDFIVCGRNHLHELAHHTKHLKIPILSFSIQTDFQLLHKIMNLPQSTRIGYACITEKSARAFFENFTYSQKESLAQFFSGLTQSPSDLRLVKSCDIVFATHFVYDTLTQSLPDHLDLKRVELGIDPESIAFIVSQIKKGARNLG